MIPVQNMSKGISAVINQLDVEMQTATDNETALKLQNFEKMVLALTQRVKDLEMVKADQQQIF